VLKFKKNNSGAKRLTPSSLCKYTLYKVLSYYTISFKLGPNNYLEL